MSFKKYVLKNRNNKFLYYLKCVYREIFPNAWCRVRLEKRLNQFKLDKDYIWNRINYYNRLNTASSLSEHSITIGDYRLPKRRRVYYFDSMEYLRFFDTKHRFNILPGDITYIPDYPTLLKSRPIVGDNKNSVILKLDKSRHFNFLEDKIPFTNKKNILVGRSGFQQTHRKRFFDKYVTHPLCDLKKATKLSDSGYLTITQHLDYKFILSLEGNDVATNLKWIMSSNSIAVMPKPIYETWYMEGTLIPDYHYICIKEDYSDLEEKLLYYIQHTEKALAIVQQANQYVDQFKNRKREDLISLLVLQKYFNLTNSD